MNGKMPQPTGLRSGGGPACSPAPMNSVKAAGAAKVSAPVKQSGGTGSTAPQPMKSGNKGG